MEERSQLVTQHLELVRSDFLEEWQEMATHYVKGRHGVYALYRGSRLFYAGLHCTSKC